MAHKINGPIKLTFGGKVIGEFEPGTIKVEEPTCKECSGAFEVTYNFTFGLAAGTHAGRLIRELPPIRFPANRAGQLGNRCLKALKGISKA